VESALKAALETSADEGNGQLRSARLSSVTGSRSGEWPGG
jgi:hypothetical protein